MPTMGLLHRMFSSNGGQWLTEPDTPHFASCSSNPFLHACPTPRTCIYSSSTIKQARDEYIKKLNGIYFANLQKVTFDLTEKVNSLPPSLPLSLPSSLPPRLPPSPSPPFPPFLPPPPLPHRIMWSTSRVTQSSLDPMRSVWEMSPTLPNTSSSQLALNPSSPKYQVRDGAIVVWCCDICCYLFDSFTLPLAMQRVMCDCT